MQSLWWQIFDILGTIAFAFSGTLVGVSRRMDLFGVLVLAAATAVGGGIVRDLLVGNIPPAALQSSVYVWIILATVFAVSFFLRYFRVQPKMANVFKVVYLLSDAIGLGSFTVTGTLLGCLMFPDLWVLDILLGVITAVGGGVVRDLMAGTIPGVFLHDVYALASLFGAVILYICYAWFGATIEFSGMVCFVITIAVRIMALLFHWNVPRVRRRKHGDTL